MTKVSLLFCWNMGDSLGRTVSCDPIACVRVVLWVWLCSSFSSILLFSIAAHENSLEGLKVTCADSLWSGFAALVEGYQFMDAEVSLLLPGEAWQAWGWNGSHSWLCVGWAGWSCSNVKYPLAPVHLLTLQQFGTLPNIMMISGYLPFWRLKCTSLNCRKKHIVSVIVVLLFKGVSFTCTMHSS